MLTLAWIVVLLAGMAVVLLLVLVAALVRFLFGGSGRPDARPQTRRRRFRFFAWIGRLVFLVLSLTLIVGGAAQLALAGGVVRYGCTLRGATIACEGLPGIGAVGWWLSLPGVLADRSNLAFEVLRNLPSFVGEGSFGLPLPAADLSVGLVAPIVLLIALAGFASILRDVRDLWAAR